MTPPAPGRYRGAGESLRVLIADDSPDARAQMGGWLAERWPSV